MMDNDLMSRQNSKQEPLLVKESPEIAKFKEKYKSPYRVHNHTRAKSSCSSGFQSQDHNFIKSNRKKVQEC